MKVGKNQMKVGKIFNLLLYQSLNVRASGTKSTSQTFGFDSPNNKAGYDRSHEGIGQDGADVSEEMSLRHAETQIYQSKFKLKFRAIKNSQYACKCACENYHCIALHCDCTVQAY